MSSQVHVRDNDNLNVPSDQANTITNGYKTDIQVYPSTSACSFGSFTIVDIKPMNVFVESVVLNFNVSAVSGITGGTPYFLPACFWIARLDLCINDTVIDSFVDTSLFWAHQLFSLCDEQRSITNYGMGVYNNTSQMNGLASTTSDYYVELWTLFRQTHVPICFPTHNIQLRIYMKSLSEIFVANSGTGTASATINSCSAIVKQTRMTSQEVSNWVSNIQKIPRHLRFYETRYQIISQPAGVSSAQYLLTALGGASVDFLAFGIRASGATGTSLIQYTALSNFDILDQGGQSLTGGSQINAARNNRLHCKYFTNTTYLVENSNNNVYCFAFSHDPVISNNLAPSGENYYRFTGGESLKITYTSSLASAVEIFVYATCRSALSMSPSKVNKISI